MFESSLERKTSDGSSFWSLSARNSVSSMFEERVGEAGEAGDDNSESPRKMLQKKRSSLAHNNVDMSLLDRKISNQLSQSGVVHEFQKVRQI